MRVFFTGELKRADIEARFGVKPAAASRDLSAYREIAEFNLEYDQTTRCYRPATGFRSVFKFSTERVLSWLLQGFGGGIDVRSQNAAPCEGPGNLFKPNLDILANVVRALCAKRPVRVMYSSMSSGSHSRVIVPVAFADNGLRWHVRAFDRENRRFGDFVLTRISKVEDVPQQAMDDELLAADEQWGRIVALELVPHPSLKWPDAVGADYGMENGMLRLYTRAALAGYVLRRWSIDCSSDHRMDPSAHHLWLKNTLVLCGVESAVLAPGYATTACGGENGDA